MTLYTLDIQTLMMKLNTLFVQFRQEIKISRKGINLLRLMKVDWGPSKGVCGECSMNSFDIIFFFNDLIFFLLSTSVMLKI